MIPDLRRVDQNLQVIRHLEGAWSLPQLPERVALDLAANGVMGPSEIRGFLTGLEGLVLQADRPPTVPTRDELGSPDLLPAKFPPTVSSTSLHTGRILAGVTGMDPPMILDRYATQRLKARLVEEGYLDLPENEIMSQRWLPEYSHAAAAMAYDDVSRRFQGQHPGSFSMEQVMKFIEDWLTPRGLYKAAVELDLFWDIPKMWDQSKSIWGGVQEWWDEPYNVVKLAEALNQLPGLFFEAAFPVLNVVLMFTGIGEVIAFGRLGMAGWKGAKAARAILGHVDDASAIAGLYTGYRGVQFKNQTRMAAEFIRFQQPSFLSTKLSSRAPGVSAAMNAWRELNAVTVAKKANQQLFKLGLVSRVEQLLDEDRGGMSLNQLTGGRLSDSIHEAMENPLTDVAIDVFLFPPSIFSPGRFIRPARAIMSRVNQGFLKVGDNQHLTLAAYEAAHQWLLDQGLTEVAQEFARTMHKKGALEAFGVLTGGDKETAGAMLAYVAVMAAVESEARRLASVMGGVPVGELDTKTLALFHHQRNILRGQLRALPENDIEEVILHFAKYGVPGEGGTYTRNTTKFLRALHRVRRQFMETPAETLARDGAVPEGFRRFIGDLDPDEGIIKWRPLAETVDGDPFFVDVPVEELRAAMGDAAADAVLRGELPLPAEFARRSVKYSPEKGRGVFTHWRLSEARHAPAYTPEGLRKLRELVRHHNTLRTQRAAEIMAELTPETLRQYVYEVMDTFGRWPDFVDSLAEIDIALRAGKLDQAVLAIPTSPTGRKMSAVPLKPGEQRWLQGLYEAATDLDDPAVYSALTSGGFSMLARDVDPVMSSFTVARVDTATKQEALGFAAAVRRTIGLYRAIRSLRRNAAILREVEVLAQAGEVPELAALSAVLAERAGVPVSQRMASNVRKVLRLMQENQLTFDDLESAVLRQLHQLDTAADWSERFMVASRVGADQKDVARRLQAKLRELNRRATFMAAEVDNVPKELAEFLAERGYKLVYGVEFHRPQDLEKLLPEFASASLRHIARARLGGFFARQDPALVSRLRVRSVRAALHRELSQVSDGRHLDLGSLPDSSNADLNSVISDLWEILRDTLESAKHSLDRAETGRAWERVATRASLARTPFSLDRLASDLGYRRLVDELLKRGYSREQARAIYRALQSAQHLGPRQHGLLALETWLRSRPNLVDGLRFLGTTKAGDHYRNVGRAVISHRPIRQVAGAITGGYAGSVASQELGAEPGSGQDLLFRAGGMVLGGAAGRSTRIGVPGMARLADKIERSDWVRYAYLADGLANMRDLLRFSLSPLFDASRYAEAITLAQIGDPAIAGLKLNQSPRAFRAMVARELREQGIPADQARDLARAEWDKLHAQFAEAARGWRDFDWEAVDGTARRFSSVGILGFSPVEWMVSTFGHLRRSGVDPRKAYQIVREIYTYGVTGRSAAELSMNFVFFPFSFTKKVVRHLGSFFSDDLTRLVVLHDMLATYQLLNEHYDLSQEWRDRLPILERAHRLNVLAYGIGLGQFGGVNAPILEALGELPLLEGIQEMVPGRPEIVNVFIPQMVPLATADDANVLWDTTRRAFPVFNDVTTMVRLLGEQGRVIFSDTHMTARAEARRGWEEWREYQQSLKAELEAAGISWRRALRNPEVAARVNAKRVEISLRYPGWKQQFGDGVAHSVILDMELEERLANPESNADLLLAQFHGLQEAVSAVFSRTGMSWERPETVPPELYDALRRQAIAYAQQDPEFLRLYNRFYRRLLGDIVTPA